MPFVFSESELQPYLQREEQLMWSGTPQTGIRLRSYDIFFIPFSILWCCFAIFWTIGATRSGAPAFFTLFGSGFVCVGLFMVFGRFIIDSKQRAATVYGITNRRILIRSGIFTKEIRSLNIQNLPEISLKVHSDGTGTLIFGNMTGWPWAASSQMPFGGNIKMPMFEFVENPQEAHNLILELQESRGISPPI